MERKTARIGPKMALVAEYVNDNPGKPMLYAAEYVGPCESRFYGYRTVHRALKAGLVVRRPGPGNHMLLYPPDPTPDRTG